MADAVTYKLMEYHSLLRKVPEKYVSSIWDSPCFEIRNYSSVEATSKELEDSNCSKEPLKRTVPVSPKPFPLKSISPTFKRSKPEESNIMVLNGNLQSNFELVVGKKSWKPVKECEVISEFGSNVGTQLCSVPLKLLQTDQIDVNILQNCKKIIAEETSKNCTGNENLESSPTVDRWIQMMDSSRQSVQKNNENDGKVNVDDVPKTNKISPVIFQSNTQPINSKPTFFASDKSQRKVANDSEYISGNKVNQSRVSDTKVPFEARNRTVSLETNTEKNHSNYQNLDKTNRVEFSRPKEKFFNWRDPCSDVRKSTATTHPQKNRLPSFNWRDNCVNNEKQVRHSFKDANKWSPPPNSKISHQVDGSNSSRNTSIKLKVPQKQFSRTYVPTAKSPPQNSRKDFSLESRGLRRSNGSGRRDSWERDEHNNPVILSKKPEEEKFYILKVLDSSGELLDEIWVTADNFWDMKRKDDRLNEIIPDLGKKKNAVPYDGNAVKAFIRYLLCESYKLSDIMTAIEIFALAKKYNAPDLQRLCKTWLSYKTIIPEMIDHVSSAVKHFQVYESLEASKFFHIIQQIGSSPTFNVPFQSNSCAVVCNAQPVECGLPLYYDECAFDLKAITETYISNELTIDTISACSISGLQLKFHPDDSCDGKDLLLMVGVRDKCLELNLKMQKVVRVDFEENLVLKKGEKKKIDVSIEDIRPRVCYCLDKDGMVYPDCFRLEITSNIKNERKVPFVFVEKIFYNVLND